MSSKSPKRDAAIALLPGALPPEYTLAEIGSPTDRLDIIGQGGSSVVVRAKYRDKLDRAVKVLIPRDDLLEALTMDRFQESYENEVSQLAKINHESLAKITDFGSVHIGETQYPYIATELIEGRPLLEHVRDSEVEAERVVQVLQDVISGLHHLHKNNVLHCDLKPDNILVKSDTSGGQDKAVIVDLGASRHFNIDADDDQELVYFYSTEKYVHPELKLVLSNRTSNRIRRGDLRAYLPLQDLYALGQTLSEVLDIPGVQSKLNMRFGSHYVDALQSIIHRITSLRAGEATELSVGSVGKMIERISATSISVLGIAELSLVPQRGVMIPSSPIRISTSSRIDQFVAHPVFQRLHQLPQLDELHYVFPGATHSRFVHALHTYDIVRQAIVHLLSDWRFRLEVSTADIERTLLGAITSQLGHYHFLHMFEDFIAARQIDERIGKSGLMTDQEMLDRIMLGDVEGVQDLPALKDSSGRTMADLVALFDVNWPDVTHSLRKPVTPVQSVLAALLNSPVDAEKLSYLRDDSAAAGLPFGANVHPYPIFESVMIPHTGDIKKGRSNGVAIGVRERAISHLEYSVLARYWNIQTAYWQRTNRSLQAMIKFVIGELILAGEMDFLAYISDTQYLSSDGAMRWLSGRFELARRSGKISDDCVNPLEPLLHADRAIYKRIVTISTRSRVVGREPDHKVFETIRGMSPLDDRKVVKTVERALTAILPDLDIKPGEVLLDLPRPRREETTGEVLVYTDMGDQLIGELFSVSPILEKQKDSFELNVKRLRIFLHPRLEKRIQEANAETQAYKVSLEALRKEWGE